MNSSHTEADPETNAFSLGHVRVAASATRRVSRSDITKGLRRHARGDWGDVTPADWAKNEGNLRAGRHLLSKYRSTRGYDFWVITDYDRRSTTVF